MAALNQPAPPENNHGQQDPGIPRALQEGIDATVRFGTLSTSMTVNSPGRVEQGMTLASQPKVPFTTPPCSPRERFMGEEGFIRDIGQVEQKSGVSPGLGDPEPAWPVPTTQQGVLQVEKSPMPLGSAQGTEKAPPDTENNDIRLPNRDDLNQSDTHRALKQSFLRNLISRVVEAQQVGEEQPPLPTGDMVVAEHGRPIGEQALDVNVNSEEHGRQTGELNLDTLDSKPTVGRVGNSQKSEGPLDLSEYPQDELERRGFESCLAVAQKPWKEPGNTVGQLAGAPKEKYDIKYRELATALGTLEVKYDEGPRGGDEALANLVSTIQILVNMKDMNCSRITELEENLMKWKGRAEKAETRAAEMHTEMARKEGESKAHIHGLDTTLHERNEKFEQLSKTLKDSRLKHEEQITALRKEVDSAKLHVSVEDERHGAENAELQQQLSAAKNRNDQAGDEIRTLVTRISELEIKVQSQSSERQTHIERLEKKVETLQHLLDEKTANLERARQEKNEEKNKETVTKVLLQGEIHRLKQQIQGLTSEHQNDIELRRGEDEQRNSLQTQLEECLQKLGEIQGLKLAEERESKTLRATVQEQKSACCAMEQTEGEMRAEISQLKQQAQIAERKCSEETSKYREEIFKYREEISKYQEKFRRYREEINRPNQELPNAEGPETSQDARAPFDELQAQMETASLSPKEQPELGSSPANERDPAEEIRQTDSRAGVTKKRKNYRAAAIRNRDFGQSIRRSSRLRSTA